ncbi:tyrosine-protein phosphatase non-receptor type 3 isoform X2 [Archocentrus centrarchus]|uniref:tyrosine-protein phosphatase non-receptor type 3 isoform X2 n=1 Tax=Archocentrus centrarchus TaxID=63155 RepID=UPI0011E9BC8C|nr:tyrosine-protein phosphatase non-receptor type 3-like isoform X2 [Archocentrus centrarchus]
MPKPDLLCLVQLLDGTIETFRVSKQDEGVVLLDLVCDHLCLQERQLFSLQIRESSTAIASIAANTHSPRWLEPEKPLKKQIKGLVSPFYLNFRVRFFISDPNSLQDEQTRHLYFLQIRSDIREGRLQCPLSAAVVLASYAVQSEMGDHCPSWLPGYLSKCHFIPEQDEDFLSKVEDLHPQHKGLKKSEAELCFLNTARTLELYGVELHTATDTNNTPLMVGLASSGVAIFCNMICSSFFPWGNIIKISFKRKHFDIHLKHKHGETQDCEVSLLLPCPKTCKNLWRSCVDHHCFFSSNRTPRSFRLKNTTIQSYRKLITQHLGLGNTKPESEPVCQRVVGGMVWNPVLRRSLSAEHLETKSLPSRSPPSTPNWRSPRVRHGISKPRPSSMELTTDLKDMSEGEDVFYTYRASVSSSKTSEGQSSPHHISGDYNPGTDDTSLQTDDSITDEDSLPQFNKGAPGDSDLMLICIVPDKEGKFGFNVKGGVDQKMPLAISHVKPDSPADRSDPKLMEGDLIVLINGRDISEHTHDQVVMFIRASRESHTRQLTLLIRRKGPGRATPLLHSLPTLTLNIQPQEDKPRSPGPSERPPTLEESMRDLERGIQTGSLCFHFENLYRRKPGLSVSCARLPENIEKNRYRDVLPYDTTRVVLRGKEDYVNASHITTKCHQYWPHPPEAKDYGNMRVKCHSEECNLAYVTRQFTLTHTQLGEERAVTHLQYVAWPDHGVPDDPSDFLLFISSVRERRKGEEPLIVHCSAGIGRTGVLITMETALAQLDQGQPVFPLDIVKTLRDQRAMMVQTTSQFQFVCEAILQVYKEKQERAAAP